MAYPNIINSHYRRRVTTFDIALPYGIITASTAVAGAALSLAAVSTAAKVAAVFIGIIGVYTFISVVLCGIKNSNNPAQFKREIHQAMVTSAGSGLVTVANQIISATVNALIDRLIYGENSNNIRVNIG